MFVTFEGPEGAGKSTAIQAVAEVLRGGGRQVVTTREPGAGTLGQRIRALLLEPSESPMPARSELFLFLADRANHVDTVIRPALESGAVVLCDRFADSTVVYQGHARGLATETLRSLNAFATGGLVPDVTLLLDLDPEVGLARIASKDRMDGESIEFHRKVRAGFLSEAALEPDRWKIVDASGPLDSVVEACLQAVRL